MSDTLPKDTRKPLSTGKKITFTLIILLFFLVLIVAAGEAIVRRCCAEDYKKDVPLPPYNTAQKDDLLGWKMTPGYTYEGKIYDEAWQEYEVSIRYDENGFKAFGNVNASRPKVFFIGDSYTASIEVSNEKSFFNLIGDSLDVEVFAYGHAGFSTLQEYLVFDEWVDKIRPDVVVWQVCSNDFIDNYAPLEIACGYKVGERRPYLSMDDEIFYRRPVSLWQNIQESLIFFKWFEESWGGLEEGVTQDVQKTGEYYISTDKRKYPPFDRSIKITEKIVAKIKDRLPGETELIAFSADIFQPQGEEFKQIFEENGFKFYNEPAIKVEQAKVEKKQVVKAIDGYHWNEQGHEIVARSLMPVLKPLIGR